MVFGPYHDSSPARKTFRYLHGRIPTRRSMSFVNLYLDISEGCLGFIVFRTAVKLAIPVVVTNLAYAAMTTGVFMGLRFRRPLGYFIYHRSSANYQMTFEFL